MTTENPEEIRAEIEQTREELGDTIEALARKTDVKAQVHDRVEETKANAAEKVDQLRGQAQDAFGRAKQATPDQAVTAAGQVSQKAAATARQNPIPVAAIGAFLAGFLLGRLSARAGDE